MTTLALEIEPTAVKVTLNEDEMMVDLEDGRRIIVPLAWYPRLTYATATERQNWQLLGNGYAIEFPDLDEHIGVEGLLAGHHSGESQKSLVKWLEMREGK
jgi:hypothetical protein